ncbi:hypothetical protein [Rhodopseudomonas sp.]|uniref:hypothetical protein n=1 Tax=Rhodopseudomonas sp. TaxID=1078 RepID=UPI0039E61B3F
MIPPWGYLAPQDRETFRAVVAFLNKRLAEQGTIDWALKLEAAQRIERIAIEHLLASPGGQNLEEPWTSAWRLVEESWSALRSERRDGPIIYSIQERLRAGDRSGAAIAAIVDLVAPRLKVEPIGSWRWNYIKKPRKPKAVEHVLSAGLTSGDLVDLNVLELANLNEVAFLTSLANALEAAVTHGLDVGRRIGWDGQRHLWQLGDLGRVYYVAESPRTPGGDDPDAYHHGIAPSVKLLHAVVARISELDLIAARSFVRRWGLNSSPVHLRLWAAMSRDEQMTPIDEVSALLIFLGQDRFWDVHGLPEIAELRAVRFRGMTAEARNAIVARIQKGPPRNHWPKKATAAAVQDAQLFWSVRELRRIEVGGGVLPDGAKTWLDAHAPQFAELAEMRIDEGFSGGISIASPEAKSDSKFDTVSGVERLRALEAALGTRRRSWDDDPAEHANSWINQQGNADKIIADFETANNGGDDFPKVWNRFGWANRPHQQDGEAGQNANLGVEAGRVLGLLNQLSDATLSNAIEGISAWLDAWERHAVKLTLTLPIWLRLWPIAVEVTNRRPEKVEDEDLSVTTRAADDPRDSMDLDTLNTPAGKLVGVFLAACPSLQPGVEAFPAASVQRQMRDVVIAAEGRSGLIAKHRMIVALPYFLHADSNWAGQHLIAPLLSDDGAALALWRAVARRTHFTEALESIGAAMAERANDRRLGRDTRRRLVFSLVIESLHAFREGRQPAVPNQRIQQMLRTLDDEVRASAANAIQVFVRDLSSKRPLDKFSRTRDGLFKDAAAPFIREVWPQERSLATPGVSSALADLPATSGDAFAEAVDTIARFLVPFECWSMANYGLYGDESGEKKLAIINDDAKARALLKLLDLTVGTSEGAVIPYDLTDALDQILKVDSSLSTNAVYRRLATAARR